MHGSGADENDLFALAPTLSAAAGGAVVASLRGPYDQLGGFAWFHGNSAAPPPAALETQLPSSAARIIAFVEAAPAALGTDPARALAFGFSQGLVTPRARTRQPACTPCRALPCCRADSPYAAISRAQCDGRMDTGADGVAA